MRIGRPCGVVDEGIGRAQEEDEEGQGVFGDILVVAAIDML